MPRSRLLFHWRSHECSLVALTGQKAVLTRAATASANDSANVSYTAVNGQPLWDWYDLDSDGVYERPALQLGTNDRCYFDFLALPRSLTVWLDFIEAGSISINNARVMQRGAAAGTAPHLLIRSNATNYLATHDNNDGSAVSATLAAAPTSGQRVRLRLGLNPDGSVLLGQRIHTGTESVAGPSGVNTLAAAWSGTRLYLNSIDASNVGAIALLEVKIAADVRSADFMERAFA